MSVIDEVLANNRRFASAFELADLDARPARRLVIVTCMDSRLDPADFLGLEPGDAHVVRNAGGVVTEDVLRSLTVSQHALGTREILIVQHTDCGMLRQSPAPLLKAIESATGSRPPFELGTFADLEKSVRSSVERLRASPLLNRSVAVRGFVYQVETGRLVEIE